MTSKLGQRSLRPRLRTKFGLVFLGLFILLAFCMTGLILTLHMDSLRREVRDPKLDFRARGQWQQVGDEELFYQDLGPREGPVVFFIGGTGAWSENWKPILKKLSEDGYRAIAIDLPPFGLSISASADFSRQAQARR